MTSQTHTVTITIAGSNVDFAPDTAGPSSIRVRLMTAQGLDFLSSVTASGSPLQAVFNEVPDGTYTMIATTLDANGNEVPSTDASGAPVVGQITGTVVVSDPPVTLFVATGITAVVS